MKTSNNSSGTQPVNHTITSGENMSVWFDAFNELISYEPLNNDINTDILVIGVRISGLTTAYCLAKEGLK